MTQRIKKKYIGKLNYQLVEYFQITTMVLGIKKMKDKCVVCKTKSIYNIDENIFFRIGYIEGAGQLCLDCYGEIYNLKPKLQGMKKLINKIKTKWRSINR
jgi:hypothetical protein